MVEEFMHNILQTRRERQRLKKWFEEKKRWREKKRQRTAPKKNRKAKNKGQVNWREFLDEEM